MSEFVEKKDLLGDVKGPPVQVLREIEILKAVLMSAMMTCEALEASLREISKKPVQEKEEFNTFGS